MKDVLNLITNEEYRKYIKDTCNINDDAKIAIVQRAMISIEEKIEYLKDVKKASTLVDMYKECLDLIYNKSNDRVIYIASLNKYKFENESITCNTEYEYHYDSFDEMVNDIKSWKITEPMKWEICCEIWKVGSKKTTDLCTFVIDPTNPSTIWYVVFEDWMLDKYDNKDDEDYVSINQNGQFVVFWHGFPFTKENIVKFQMPGMDPVHGHIDVSKEYDEIYNWFTDLDDTNYRIFPIVANTIDWIWLYSPFDVFSRV